MDDQLQSKSVQQPHVENTKRREFLCGMGAVGLAAMSSAVNGNKAEAQIGGNPLSPPPKLSSIAALNVTREQTLDVPNGKESFFEWEASDAEGVTTRFIVHTTRIDVGETYTVNTGVTVQTFARGVKPGGEPTSTTQQNMTAFGEKGEVEGALRHDTVTITTVHGDGSSSRETRIVPVRLDLSEYQGLDLAAVAAKIGSHYVGH
jgi:hypothetical protein